MKKLRYFVCPDCGSLTFTSGQAEVSCCGRKLAAPEPRKAAENEKLKVEAVENDWYITGDHPMRKDDYVSFLAFACGDRVQVVRLYPEWDLQARIPAQGHGMLLWYSHREGLLYQLL